MEVDSFPLLEEQILCGHFGGAVLEICDQPPVDVVDRVIENLIPPQNLSSGECPPTLFTCTHIQCTQHVGHL